MECPVCLEGDVSERVALCSNGHKFCEDCQTRTLSTGHWCRRTNRLVAHCPMCRENLPYTPPVNDAEHRPLYPVLPGDRPDEVARFQIANRTEQHRNAYREFITNRAEGTIPATATFGGIHNRCCGHRQCRRRGGSEGVRFLLWNYTDNRRYRCEEHQNE